MSVENKADLEGLIEAGRIVKATLDAMQRNVEPGRSTRYLNNVGAAVLEANGARSAPQMVYGFPAEICISLNEEIVHGIPSDRVIEEGDLVKLDVVAEKDGYMADAAVTVIAGKGSESKQALVECARNAFYRAASVAKAGNRVNHIGRAVEKEVVRSGFTVVEGLAGHGVGRAIHEEPSVPNVYDFMARQRLTKGLVITIEPMVSMGSGAILEMDDGWTISTADGSLSAHYEHTMVITKGAPFLITA